MQAHKAMFEKTLNQLAKPSEVVAASLNEREKELELLRTRWDRQKQASTPAPEQPKAKIVERVLVRLDIKFSTLNNHIITGTIPTTNACSIRFAKQG